MKTQVRKFHKMPTGHYENLVWNAVNTRSRHFFLLREFGNAKSAETIRWMVENGAGLAAFKAYVPGTFEAEIRNDKEVWFRVRD